MDEKNRSSMLILPNNLYSVLAAQAYAEELAKEAGFDLAERARVCLALEEAILNVVTHSFGPEVTAMYQVAFRVTHSTFTIILRDHGVPFEDEVLAPRDMTVCDVDDYPPSGLGLHIMRNSVDHVVVRNCPVGKELRLIKHLSHPAPDGQSGGRDRQDRVQ
ncbi:MAG: serine-protein kinase RsbW [Syntrophorhabdus sp. PtaB.Bin184]|nr:MAG: serine-protein kinase RsbW [Syntrophorhabdus sp. PtaB.Bin184]